MLLSAFMMARLECGEAVLKEKFRRVEFNICGSAWKPTSTGKGRVSSQHAFETASAANLDVLAQGDEGEKDAARLKIISFRA